ncbi:PTS lactose/cellobiose transporter subunit IIA [Enterococcus raffinosus]|jgi:PTS system cellobiose-specific IIA component|uniref:PTS lactose/cellobiose transporter subunit IIA n=1 Tax=Enterococcus raffinosus TaxID=71452 RepID=A0AAP5KEP0_9ENTE|nr:PTS lactose/cellobiose transporter subunit IIA [Enterococcus raffinosus]MBS6431345.1 PTS lactose/cellobiose transporter subunit IIA [Enterococcus raffinosus]MDK7991032.1 PTS lactose/cellobiose transporter subunit IIA [Enterococcus raffinosus]MDT2524890.1 PTS lactose/cellobiose transporter subunit IIA [Enterococcus raffinosus]MDT2530005.1 PTS lactose/cellobiose transporter subunit IIA [Enterococcus raffinosus]MDT2535578.1 PTS lactose/cellobiose transporter subunit IIA [Enterococcus raffinosu
MNDQEMDIFKIISAAGDSRGSAFEALRLARKGKFDEAEAKMQEAKEKSIDAHDVQTQLITSEINGEKTETSLLMVHAQDHLMTSILARDLIEEMIGMLKEQSEAKALH